jgi:hypothetical protein
MGNAKSTSCSNSTSVTEQDLRLTDYDMTIYEHRKEKIFKGTIAVCIVYAFIALLILLTSFLFPTIKYVIFEKFLPFTIVFIVGTILLIIYLFYNILNFNPIKINKNYDYTNISCPDYWKLEYNPVLKNYFDSNTLNTNIFNYRCVPDPNIFSKTDLYFNRKNQLGSTDANAIGITGANTPTSVETLNTIANYNDVNKDSIDNDKQKYIIADLKHNKNKEIVNKIAGTIDSNVYKNLVESSLLMNNYFFDSNASRGSEYNIYKHISQANLSTNSGFDTAIITGFNDAKQDELNLKHVNFGNDISSGSAVNIANNYTIKIKKNIVATGSEGEYLDDNNIKYNTNAGNSPDSALKKIPLVCNRVYPLLLSAKDKELSRNSSGRYDENVLRCAYSKMCGIPWSDMNCDKYDV